MHHDGLGSLPGRSEPVQVLVVVEDVAAGPVDQLDVGVGVVFAVEVVAVAGPLEHLGDPRRRDDGWVGRERRNGKARYPLADLAGAHVPVGAEGKREPTPRETDLAQRGGEREGHPVRLLTVVGPLDREAEVDQRSTGGHEPGELDDGRLVEPGDLGGPLSGLGGTVRAGCAGEVRPQLRPADAEALQEGLVGQALGHQGVDEARHQGNVGSGADRQPTAVELGRLVVAERAPR